MLYSAALVFAFDHCYLTTLLKATGISDLLHAHLRRELSLHQGETKTSSGEWQRWHLN